MIGCLLKTGCRSNLVIRRHISTIDELIVLTYPCRLGLQGFVATCVCCLLAQFKRVVFDDATVTLGDEPFAAPGEEMYVF